MPKFAANLSMMYNEVEFLDRFDACARDGFKFVEYLFPYAFPKEVIAEKLQEHGLQQVLFNASPGDWAKGERGLASLPGREVEFEKSIAQAMDYAQALNCKRIHVMAGLVPEGADLKVHHSTYVKNIRHAAAEAAKINVSVLLEPINTRSIPGFFLNYQHQAMQVIEEVGAENVFVQMDFFHVQIMEGDIAMTFRKNQSRVGHIQVAGVPERHEPSLGEVNYPYLFDMLDREGYAGYIGCEYVPQTGTREGLGWIKPYL